MEGRIIQIDHVEPFFERRRNQACSAKEDTALVGK